MEQYCILGRIGEGAHGIVFKAKHVETGEIVALKKVALRRLEDGIPNQALREIKALQEIEDSQYVVQLKAVFPHGAGFVLAFEFMLSDLAEVVRHAQRLLTQAQVKSYLQMLLKGVAFCHANNTVHREIKDLPDYNKISFKEQAPVPLEEVLPDASPQALDLLGHFLLYPPRQRIAASQALLHQYFFTAPLPAHPSELPIPQRPGGPALKAPPGPPHVHDLHVDRPLKESLLNPELIRPFILEG
uniref:Cyclin-dependent kinase 20 n=1 Tax=Balaenoptera musculus TaxID=9771 RepID=A0A8C0CLM5_BALMU